MIHPHLQDTSWVADRLPRLLPIGWERIQTTEDGARYLYRRSGIAPVLSVIISGCIELDGKRWIHVSCAYMGANRNTLLGRDAKAIQVLAPASEHITIHDFCLHLWHCVDGDPLPDFTHGGQGL